MLHFMVDCTFMHLASSPVPSPGGGGRPGNEAIMISRVMEGTRYVMTTVLM